jgi:uncharacterized membrane protein
MRLGDVDPVTLRVVTILTALIFVFFAGTFFAGAKQQWHKNRWRALTSVIFGVTILVFSFICTYLFLS